MAMVNTSIFSSNLIYLKPNPITKYTPYTFKPHINNFQLPRATSFPSSPINVNYLQTEFNGHAAEFSSLGDSCVVRMCLDNGSVATLMLPSGLVTSYKAPMWHGGLLELLHTSVSVGENEGGAVIRGGVSVVLRCEGCEKGGVVWSPGVWDLRSVGGSPDESIKVELISSNPEEKIEIKHIVTLQQDAISSEIVTSNLRPSSLRLTGSIIGHLAVRPNDGVNNKTTENGQEDEETEGEEEENYKHLSEKMSMIYTSAPRSLTIMDRGKRNSVIVGREGFEELYIFSPGSRHKSYSKYSYICIGQAALLKPITIGPQSEWRGVQHLHNPNM